jgi:hypothetical protein
MQLHFKEIDAKQLQANSQERQQVALELLI